MKQTSTHTPQKLKASSSKCAWLLGLLMLTGGAVHAQSNPTKSAADFTKNNVKINLFSLPMKNISLQYERGLGAKTSVAVGFRLQPKGVIPFQGAIRNLVESDEPDNAGLDFVNNATMGNWAITPEFRFYMGKKPHNGFYFAPFVRIGDYSLDWLYKYEESNGTLTEIDMKGKLSTIGGGLMIGAQWHLGSRILLDWWILGPQYNSSKLTLNGTTDLSHMSQADRDDLTSSLQDISFPGGSASAEVKDDGVKVTGSFGIPGIRTGLCIGFTF